MREAQLPVHPALAQALEPLPYEGPFVFPGRTPGTHIAPATLNLWVRIVGARARVHLTPHMLRHTSIAAAHDATELRTAMTWARHRNPTVTAGYTRTTQRRLQEVLGAL